MADIAAFLHEKDRKKYLSWKLLIKTYTYQPKGVCSVQVSFDLDDDNKIHNVRFIGGCNGNLKAIGLLVEGKDAAQIADILRGNDCSGRGTSCADQFSKALDAALAEQH